MNENLNSQELIGALNDASRSLSDFQTSMGKTSQTSGILTAARGQANQSIEKEAALRSKNTEVFKNSAQEITKTMGGLAKGLASGNTSFTQFNSVIDVTTKLIGGLASSVPFFGKALDATAQAVGEATKVMLQEFEKGWDAFRGLADTGVTTTFTQLKDISTATGMRYERVNAVVGKYSGTLARLGGTTGEGAKQFSALASASTETRNQFYRLGINAEEFNEFQLKYLDQQVNTGRARAKTQQDLERGSVRYIEELDALTKLTGLNRKDIHAQREKALSESKFAASVHLMGEKVEKTALELNTLVSERGGPALAQGLRDLMSGNVTSDAAKQLVLQTQGKALEVVQQVRDGAIDSKEAYNKIQQSIDPKKIAEYAQNVGDANILTNQFAELLKISNSGIITDEQQAAILKSQKDAKSGADAMTNDAATASQKLEKVSTDLQQLATDSTMVTKTVENFAKGMETFISWVREKLGEGSNTAKSGGTFWGSLAATAGGAAAGATVGSMVGPVGTIIGGIAGGIAGFAAHQYRYGDYVGNDKAAEAASAQPTASATAPAATHAPANSHGAETAPAPSTQSSGSVAEQSLQQVKEAGLKIRPTGDVYQGGLLSNTALQLAKSIQTSISTFGMFTGLNDVYHKVKHPRSYHAFGRGIDFTLAKSPTPEEAQEIKKQLEQLPGVRKGGVKNEYFKPPLGDMNQYTTGPHFHVDAQARTGGIFRGPSTGYPVMLHDEEIVVPANSDMGKQVLNSGNFGPEDNNVRLLNDFISMMEEKFGNMISILGDTTGTQDKMLQSMN
jgi:hypothetical protein